MNTFINTYSSSFTLPTQKFWGDFMGLFHFTHFNSLFTSLTTRLYGVAPRHPTARASHELRPYCENSYDPTGYNIPYGRIGCEHPHDSTGSNALSCGGLLLIPYYLAGFS